MSKFILSAGLLCLSSLAAGAQTMFFVTNGAEKYNIPINSTISVDAANGFTFALDGKTYQLPLGSKIGLSSGDACLPITVKGNEWRPGVSSLQSNSTGLFSYVGNDKFNWTGDRVYFNDYGISGTVVDSVMNLRFDANNTRYYGKSVDILFYKVATGETGMYSLPSNTCCEWKQNTHVGKYGALVLSYAVDPETGGRQNNVVGVAKWTSQLGVYEGVSGREYPASGTVEYFDDLATAKDVVLNQMNFQRSSGVLGSLSAPTWNYLTAGSAPKQADMAPGSAIAAGKLTLRDLMGLTKPTASDMENGYACRFDSPDEHNVIVDYYYTAADANAQIQYPELKSALQTTPGQYDIMECNTWKGGTCLYLVPSNGVSYSKYRKYDGYVHIRMVDGSEYSQHLTIDKKGVITADGTWKKDKDATLSVTAADSYEDNGNLQYYGLKFMANTFSTKNGLDKFVVDYAKAHAVEADLEASGTLAFIPRMNAYVPFGYGGLTPARRVHYCIYSFQPADNEFLGAAIGKKGLALTVSGDISSTFNEKAPMYWLFEDAEHRMICYTLTTCGYLGAIEWYE